MRIHLLGCTAGVLCLAALSDAGVSGLPVHGWKLQDQALVRAGGEAISKVGCATGGWHKAVVPGTVLTSLVTDGVYPEPLYGQNNNFIPESLCHTKYWYRTEVQVPNSLNQAKRWLRFDGINYIANVWVNGRKVGDIHGAFARGIFDVTADTKPGTSAAIAVEILPPAHPGAPHVRSLAAGTGRNGGQLGADNPTFHATVGWDWIPTVRDRDIGIWQGVTLYGTGPVVVSEPYVKTVLPLPRTDAADVSGQATVTNETDVPQSGSLTGSYQGIPGRFVVPFNLGPRESKVLHGPVDHVNRPPLWWPNGYGPQNMCRLLLTARVGRGVSDETRTSFGIRSISACRPGETVMTISVNGVPIMCKGGNWGMDEAMKRSPAERLDAQLRLHHDANCTMVRNWIGMSTQEDFYDACDKYGILVWDDFWLANPADGPPPLHPDWFLANAREKLVRFRNHPSIAVWCGRNEGNPPKVIDDGLAALTSELDPSRFYQRSSSFGNGVGGGGPYSARPLTAYFAPFRDSIHTEIGAPSIPTLEAVQAMMPEKDWWPINDDWAEHDLCRGAQAGDAYLRLIVNHFGPLASLADFVRKSQLENYDVYRAIFEGRNARLFKPASGVLLWMSNPCRPSFVWQLYSYDLEPNAAGFGTQKACEPVHIQMNPLTGQVQVINNTPSALDGVVATAALVGLDGKASGQALTKSLTAAASAATDALILPPAPGVQFVKLELRDHRGKLLADNFYWRTEAGSSDFTSLESLPKAGLRVTAHLLTDGARTRIAVSLRNPGKTVALMAHMQLRDAATGKRVLPAFYTDNYISLLPGESRRLIVECATKDLHGDTPSLVLDGWNTVVADGRGTGDVPVTTNAAAFAR